PASPDTPLAIPPDAVQGVYLAYHALVNRADYDRIVRLLETTSLNARVIDFKNNWGYLTYPVQTAPAAGAGANRFVVHALPRRLAELKSARIYTVARIVAFKDNLLARTHPHLAAHTSGGGQLWRDERDAAWVNPQHPETWAYILQVALEAARLGFDEIQFDCLRFPRPGPGGQPQFLPPRPLSPQTRARAIAGFLSAARGQLAPFGVKLTATAAGRVCWRRDDSLLGQRLEQMAPYLDAICPHLHPAAFTGNAPGPRNIASRPYSAIFQATRRAVGRLKALRSPCRVRPWIQDFEGNGTARRTFGPAEVRAQIRAVFEGGGAGYMAWDPKLAYTAAAYRRPDSSRSQAG
ncbi:MAG: putative glycoside hydrolase, partial [Anaerolineae bacterium]